MEKLWRMEGSLVCPRYPAGRANFSYISSLRFSKTRELWSSNATFAIAFYAAVNHNYDHKQQTMKHWNTQNGSNSTNHKPWTFELAEVNFFFLRDPQRWLTAAKNANVSWLLNFRIRVFSVKSAVKDEVSDYMTNTEVGPARFTLLAGLTLLQITLCLAQPGQLGQGMTIRACESSPVLNNRSMRELCWLKQRFTEKKRGQRFSHINVCLSWLDREGDPSTQDRFSPYNRGLRDTIKK